LLNKCLLENRCKILSNLIVAYVANNPTTSKKLKAQLFYFFDEFKKSTQNLKLLITAYMPLVNFLIGKNANMSVLREVARFFYFITSGTGQNLCPNLVSLTLDEIFKNINKDFYLTQKLIELLLEFSIKKADIQMSDRAGEDDPILNKSMQLLATIMNHVQKLIVS
jgi:hypothetical protein